MSTNDILAALNVLVAFLGVAFAVFAGIEWWKLRTLRKEMGSLEKRTMDALYASLKATHRIIASYQISSPDARIRLLESALSIEPGAYNGWNTLGYAWLDKNDLPRAIDAFMQAIHHHPEDKAGYCDLAYAYCKDNKEDLAVKYLRKAISVDATARDDIAADGRFASILPKILS